MGKYDAVVKTLSKLEIPRSKQKGAGRKSARIYNWFTAGFETKDLQETKALLAELV